MKAVLVGVSTEYDIYDISYSLDELSSLADTLGIECVYSFYQNREKPDSKTYIGKGKLEEIKFYLLTNEVDMVIFNDELSPTQLRNVNEILGVECIDRSYLILKIFEGRSKDNVSKLEIKLAYNMYMLPRVEYMKNEESRIGGGGITRGKGETSQELSRRHIFDEINRLNKKLDSILKMKSNQIEKRKKNGIPIVALVGYTNAGKSTTMNTILDNTENDKLVYAQDEFFATLATSNRHIKYNNVEFLLVDTIGFVSKMSPNLVKSFYLTLEEIKNADLIIRVVDSSSKYLELELNTVLNVLYQMNVTNIPQIMLLNKWDKTISNDLFIPNFKNIKYSNVTKLNVSTLLDEITNQIKKEHVYVKLFIPYEKGDLINLVETKGEILEKKYDDKGAYFECNIHVKFYSKLRDYDLELS